MNQNVWPLQALSSPAMNLLSAKAAGGQVHLTDGTRVQMQIADNVTGDVIVGIRPEHLTLDSNGSLEITDDEIEPTGSETHISATSQMGVPIKIVTSARVSAQPSETLVVGYESEHLHLFDVKTTERISSIDRRGIT